MVRNDYTPSLSSLLSIPETQARVGGGPVFLHLGKKNFHGLIYKDNYGILLLKEIIMEMELIP